MKISCFHSQLSISQIHIQCIQLIKLACIEETKPAEIGTQQNVLWKEKPAQKTQTLKLQHMNNQTMCGTAFTLARNIFYSICCSVFSANLVTDKSGEQDRIVVMASFELD